MRMAICTMPGCQTSAGCKCNPPVYLAPLTPSPAEEWYGKELEALNTEIARLRLSISEARATGRREGMEEAARYHDRQIADLEERIAENNAYCEKHGINISSANNYCRKLQFFNRLSAADIRAAKEKHGKRRNAADG